MPKIKAYKCPECGKVYKTQRGFDTHMDLAHSPVDENDDQEREEAEYAEEMRRATAKPVPNEQPLPAKEPVAEVETDTAVSNVPFEFVDTAHLNESQPVKDAKKVWFSKYKWWIIVGVALLLLWFIVIRPWLDSRADEAGERKISNTEKEIDAIYGRLDSLETKDKQLANEIRIAVDISSEAKAVATKANTDLTQVKKESEKSFQSIKKSSDEIIKKLNAAPDVRAIDDIFDSIERSRAEMFQN